MTTLHLNSLQGSLLTSIPLTVFAGCPILVSKLTGKTNSGDNQLVEIPVLGTKVKGRNQFRPFTF
ncbi:hypothetical protein [Chitinophaga dinghuensis]|uniref:hypothetical protein n=1 Tax=Chitinophaga dinghuensis TaxID=1539050 RepID=UPI000DB91726|nr:hypothetical protein [Chitinophaga dinghuensis]